MTINRMTAKDALDEWIGRVVPGRSFIDIGGIGEYSGNERSSFAANAGASRSAMADFLPFEHHLWSHYRQALEEAGVSGIEFFEQANIDDPGLAERLGQWDVVHSTGILYHVPNPVHTLLNVKRLVRRHLILNTVILPNCVKNEEGTFELPDSGVALFAALRGRERAVLRRYYKDHFGVPLDDFAPEHEEGALMPYMAEAKPSYFPYWWIFTRHSFEALLQVLDMRILDRNTWRGHAHAVFLERN